MTTLRVLAAALLLALIPYQSAQACSRIAVTSVRNLTTLPLAGATAPRNTKLWTLNADPGEFTLVDARGTLVALQRSSITVIGEAPVTLEILTPMSLLDPGAFVFSRGTTELSRFTVTSDVDEVAPPAPTPTVSSVVGEYSRAYFCGNPSLVTLTLPEEVALAVAVQEGQSWQVTSALGVGSGLALDLAAPAVGAQRLVVFSVDLAGNATPSEVVTATVPEKTSGCSATGAALPLALLALALIRRRRQH